MQPILVEEPTRFPGKCFLDGQVRGPALLVTQIPDPVYFHGAVYFSRGLIRDSARMMRDVVEELARELRWVPADEHERELVERDRRIVDLEAQVAELEPVMRGVALAVSRYGDTEADDEPVARKPREESARPPARRRRAA